MMSGTAFQTVISREKDIALRRFRESEMSGVFRMKAHAFQRFEPASFHIPQRTSLIPSQKAKPVSQ